MKKVLSLILALAMCLTLCACGDSGKTDAAPSQSDTGNIVGTTAADDNSAGVEVDEHLFTIDITMPKSFFEDTTDDEIVEAAKENGITKCVINKDGSVTYTMTKAKHEEMLAEMRAGFDESFAGMIEGEEAVASFVSIDYTDDFSQIDVYVNDQYTEWDSFYALAFYLSGAYYQSFAGVNADEIDVIVNFIDNETKEILNTASYQEYISNQ